MTRVPVRSSTLVSVGYDEHQQVLEVEFRRKSVYQYFGVSKALHEQLVAASSKGKFSDQRIREKFRTVRVS